MKTSLIKTLVVTFSFGAVGLLALSPGKAASTTSAAPAAAPAASPMGACCGQQAPAEPPATSCGEGTYTDTKTGECKAEAKKK